MTIRHSLLVNSSLSVLISTKEVGPFELFLIFIPSPLGRSKLLLALKGSPAIVASLSDFFATNASGAENETECKHCFKCYNILLYLNYYFYAYLKLGYVSSHRFFFAP